MASPTPQNTATVKLYIALFNRAPDGAGFAFWTQALENGASLTVIAQSMLAAPEALAIYPAAQNNAQFVTSYYTNVFGRAPDAEGLAFWSAVLAAEGGAASFSARATLVLKIADIVSAPLTSKPAGMSDTAYAQTVADRVMFANKIEFSVYFAAELRSNDVALAKATLAIVNDSPMSILAATRLALGIVDTPPVVPTPVITAADTGPVIASKFSSYDGTSATVNATGMDDAQLAAVVAVIPKIAANGITGLTLTLNALDDAVTAALLPKSTGTTVVATGASAGEITALFTNISHVVNGGISGSLDLSLTQFASITNSVLNPKLAAGVALTISGTASADPISLTGLTVGTRVEGGGGTDTITLGGGADTVVIGSTLETRNTASIGPATVLDTVYSISADDRLLFSPLANAFGTGLTLADATVNLVTIAGPASIASYAALFSLPQLTGSTASSNGTANFYLVNLAAPVGGIGGYLILNDGDAVIDVNDMIIIVGPGVTAANLAFGV